MMKKIAVATFVGLILSVVSVFAITTDELAASLPKDIKTVIVEVTAANMEVDVSSTFKAAETLFLYKYNEDTNKLELIDDNVVVNVNGKVNIAPVGKLCVLANSAITEALAENKPLAPEPMDISTNIAKTGDNTYNSIGFWGGAVILGIGALVVIKQTI